MTTFFSIGGRPVGSDANQQALDFLNREAERMGYTVRLLPFPCLRWTPGESFAIPENAPRIPLLPGPYSPPCDLTAPVFTADSLAALSSPNATGKILILRGELAKDPISPRDFPWYYPDEHRAIHAALDATRPAAILAVTGAHPSCGLNPFPLFDDPHTGFPSAYLSPEAAIALPPDGTPMRLRIDSLTEESRGAQPVYSRKADDPAATGKRMVCAHMDTAHDTPGALDNGTGVDVLLGVMERLKDTPLPFQLEFVPFNGEDCPTVPGEIAYLDALGAEIDTLQLVVNVDAPACKGGNIAISGYNLDPALQTNVTAARAGLADVQPGPEWVEGDHSIFAFRGIPCVAVTSSNLRETVCKVTHTPQDTPDLVDPALIAHAADFIAALLRTAP